jgi:hypothetical protein
LGPGAAVAEAPEPTRLILAVDISNYGGRLSDAQVAGLAAAGVEHVIVRISLEDTPRQAITAQQLATLRACGMSVSGYLFPDYNQQPSACIKRALGLAGAINTLWIDIEGAGLPSAQAIGNWVRSARSSCPVRIGIYTAAWVVAGIRGLNLADFPLWAAAYGPRPDSLDVSFGGWQAAAGIQFADTVTVGGVSCDLNIFDAAALG